MLNVQTQCRGTHEQSEAYGSSCCQGSFGQAHRPHDQFRAVRCADCLLPCMLPCCAALRPLRPALLSSILRLLPAPRRQCVLLMQGRCIRTAINQTTTTTIINARQMDLALSQSCACFSLAGRWSTLDQQEASTGCSGTGTHPDIQHAGTELRLQSGPLGSPSALTSAPSEGFESARSSSQGSLGTDRSSVELRQVIVGCWPPSAHSCMVGDEPC